jgi:GAF domain-containing protein
MSFEIHATEQPRYFLRLNASATAANNHDFAPLLEHLSGQANADGIVVYRFDSISGEFAAVAAQSNTGPRIPELGVTLGTEASAWLKRSREHVQFVLETDARFANLPEGLQYGFRRLLLVPLRAGDTLLGLVTVGRQTPDSFNLLQLTDAVRIARVMSVILERDALHVLLRERKIVERAKGILQQKRKLSEESAYMFLRETSRRLRLPMLDVAREVIQSSTGARYPALGNTA